jgi:hypothetical protein
MENKEFAEENAGKYFALRGGYKVRVVGYRGSNNCSILVSIPKKKKKNAHDIGWSRLVMDEYDILLIPSRADRFRYVDIAELKRWK